MARSGFGVGSSFGSGTISGLTRSTALGQLRRNPRFGFPFSGIRGGCWNWNCGFGYGQGPGWGFGLGWPWFGFGGANPYWNGAYGGWPGGYGNYGYPSNYLYDDSGNYDYGNGQPSYDDSVPQENYLVDDQSAPAAQSAPQTVNPEEPAVPVLFYMKNGSVYSASSYWVADGKLHFIFPSGGESSVDVNQLDIQRTVDVNAKSGVPFTLRPGPDPNSSEPTPDTNGTPPNPTGSSRPDAGL